MPLKKKNPAAVALGKLGSSKGGKARAAKLSAERRREISQLAARARRRSLSKKERSDSARKAALARWRNVKRKTALAQHHRT